jgi:hypothetical protein
MRTIIAFVAALLLTCAPASAQTVTNVTPATGAACPNSFQTITVLTAAVGFTLPTTCTAVWAFVTVEGQSVRWRDDGVAPTATVGQLAVVGSSIYYKIGGASGPLSAMQFIQTGATASLDVSFYSK